MDMDENKGMKKTGVQKSLFPDDIKGKIEDTDTRERKDGPDGN